MHIFACQLIALNAIDISDCNSSGQKVTKITVNQSSNCTKNSFLKVECIVLVFLPARSKLTYRASAQQ